MQAPHRRALRSNQSIKIFHVRNRKCQSRNSCGYLTRRRGHNRFGNPILRDSVSGLSANGSPANTFILSIFAPSVRNSNKIHQTLAVTQTILETSKLRIIITDHEGLCMIQNFLDTVDHQSRYVRNVVKNEVAIGTNQAGQIHVLVKNAQVITLTNEALNHFDHGTLSQIICSRFEAEPQDSDPLIPLLRDETYAAVNLQFVARQNCRYDARPEAGQFAR